MKRFLLFVMLGMGITLVVWLVVRANGKSAEGVDVVLEAPKPADVAA